MTWGRRRIRACFWWESQKDRFYLEDLYFGKKIKLKWIFER
jgi:hypothetical protein